MRLLRQSTAVTIKSKAILDIADLSAETGQTIQKADVRLAKDGGNMAAASADQGASDAGAPHDELGKYDISLNTTDTNTLEILDLVIAKSGTIPCEMDFLVVPANVYDSLVAGSDALDVSLIQWLGTAPLALDSQRVQALAVAIANNAITTAAINDNAITAAKIADGAIDAATFAAGAIDASAIAADAIGSSELAATAAAEIATAVRTELATELGRVDAAITTRATPAQVAAELATYDGPTNAEMEARTLAAASYATAAGVADVPTVAEFEARTLAADNYATAAGLADVPTVAEFEARTIAAANYALDSTVAKEATLADVPTNAELAARTLAAADYATAAGVAAVQATVDTIDGRLDDEIPAIIAALALINTDTDDIQSRLPAALVGGLMASDAQAINSSVAAAVRLELSAGQITPFTVDHTGFTATQTIFEADDITTAAADHWNTRLVLFTSGALIGQIASIEDYELSSGRGRFTVSQLTSAPANNVTGVII